MKRKIYLKILFGIIAFVLLSMFLTKLLAEPWIGKQIQASLNANADEYKLNKKLKEIKRLKHNLIVYKQL